MKSNLLDNSSSRIAHDSSIAISPRKDRSIDRSVRHNSQLIAGCRRIDRKISAAIRSPMGWFTGREIARKGKTRIVHYAGRALFTHTCVARQRNTHPRWKSTPVQIRPPPTAFFACLDIYCFNLPWPCLIMESSFWPATAARPHRLSRRFCVYTWSGGGGWNGCSANRLWISETRSSLCVTLHVSRDGDYALFLNGRAPSSKGTRIPCLFSVDDEAKLKKIERKKEGEDRSDIMGLKITIRVEDC